MALWAFSRTNAIIDKMSRAAKDSASNIEASSPRDTVLIANGNMVEHHEIGLYGSLAAFARALRRQEAVSLFEQTLEEEKKADTQLRLRKLL